MTYRIAIPSYERPETLANKTLQTLVRGRVPLDRIDLHVLTDQAPTYRARHPNLNIVTHDIPHGVKHIRNAIARHYPYGTRLLCIDDDVSRIVKRADAKTLIDAPNVHTLINDAFDLTDRAGLCLWGIYPVKNPYFMKERIRTDLTYIEGAFFGYTVRQDDAEIVTCDDKEDFERSIRFYIRDGGVVRIENYSMVSNFYTEPGGMQTYRSKDTVEAGARYLAATYPDYCTYFISKSRNMPEVRLRDKSKARP